MLKAKHIIIIFIVNYCILLLLGTVGEMLFLSDKAQHIQTLMRTAGDMALEQTQATDDFFVNGEYGGAYSLKFPRSAGRGYIEKPMYEGIYNKSDVGSIYEMLYTRPRFQKEVEKWGRIRTPVRYASGDVFTGSYRWYTVPRVVEMGLDILPNTTNTMGVETPSGGYAGSITGLYEAYGMDKYEKVTGGRKYYVTPLSLGLTYIDEELLGVLFMNNMDLLMRTKYAETGKNLNKEEGGEGVLRGSYYSDKMTGRAEVYNPINDGKFTLLRGERLKEGSSEVQVYKGITPKIEYKVIDMYDSSNDEVLKSLFGAKTEGKGSKAEYLKYLDRYRVDPSTGSQPKSKPIIVAKVTFYADVIVPYTMPIVLDYKSDEGGFLEIERRGTSGKRGEVGSDVMTYTRYFAVTP